ncbi:hypothetical protein [Thermoplasma sp.]|uniref:hypothetical protein n=1 Tax=Thermoplasma sp. TaxID=1973142 RepID=UPI0026235A6D|nr:hypothetical protein [Thermoplasma sp.]
MKGSVIRKRYILVWSSKQEELSRDLFRTFRCKVKFHHGDFAIYLATQFNKDRVIQFINSYDGSRSIITSGTIRKCKKKMQNESLKEKLGV